VTRRLEKRLPNFLKIAQKVAKSKKGQKCLQQSSFCKPKTSTQTTFETLKVAQWRKIAQSGHPVSRHGTWAQCYKTFLQM
jgi:hypothetical protein